MGSTGYMYSRGMTFAECNFAHKRSPYATLGKTIHETKYTEALVPINKSQHSVPE